MQVKVDVSLCSLKLNAMKMYSILEWRYSSTFNMSTAWRWLMASSLAE
jgi:hypothetical protein